MKDFSLSPQQWQQRVYTSNAEYIFEGPDLKSQTIYIQGGDGLAAIVNYNADGDDLTMAYATHLDYLGSLEILSKEDGSLFYEQSFDAWGKIRNPDTWQFDPNYQANQPNWLWRGYTGHEMLYEFDLIHMNGRLYDPFVGRMLSPDNFVQDATSTQNYNRYSYVVNNPLKFTDPSGEIIWAAVIAGAVIGGYIGGATANGGDLDARNWNWQSGKTWGGIGAGLVIGGAAGFGAGELGTAIAPGLAGVFGKSGTVAAWTLAGGIGGAAGGYGSGLVGGLMYSQGNWDYAHKSGLYGAQIGGTVGSVFGTVYGFTEAINPYYEAELKDFKNNIQDTEMGCKDATCASIEEFNGGSRSEASFTEEGKKYLAKYPNATLEEYWENFGFDVYPVVDWGYKQIGRSLELGNPFVVNKYVTNNQTHTLTLTKMRQWRQNGPIKVWFADPQKRRRQKFYFKSTIGNGKFNSSSYIFWLNK